MKQRHQPVPKRVTWWVTLLITPVWTHSFEVNAVGKFNLSYHASLSLSLPFISCLSLSDEIYRRRLGAKRKPEVSWPWLTVFTSVFSSMDDCLYSIICYFLLVSGNRCDSYCWVSILLMSCLFVFVDYSPFCTQLWLSQINTSGTLA